MATRIIDQQKAIDVLSKYRQISIEKGAGGTTVLSMLCPFHDDTNPSFKYTPAKDHGMCWACNSKANLAELISKCEGADVGEQVIKDNGCQVVVRKAKTTRKTPTVDVSDAQINQWHEALATDMALLGRVKQWGWSSNILQRYKLGSSEGRLVFPIYERESLVNVKFYSPGATAGNKYQNMAGSYQGCWPLENLDNDLIYVVEGEKDCLTMLSQGFNAVTFTGGAKSIPTAYLKFFSGKHVIIIYDIDEAGHQGAQNLAQALSRITATTKVVDIPPNDMPAKGDITDLYMKNPTDFKDYIHHYVATSDIFKGQEAISRIPVPPIVYPTYLENMVSGKLFFKRVSMKVRVVNNAKSEVTLIPKNVTMRCNKDYKEAVCGTCPMFFEQNGIPLHIKPEYPEIMSIVGNNMKTQKEALRSLCEIAPGCPRFKVEYGEFQALYPIVIIPAIEANKDSHDYSLVGAWALDVPAKENEDYAIEGVVLANPETQKLELICYKMEKDGSSLDEFELEETIGQQLVEVFQCRAQA